MFTIHGVGTSSTFTANYLSNYELWRRRRSRQRAAGLTADPSIAFGHPVA